jgi:hypothetical protein
MIYVQLIAENGAHVEFGSKTDFHFAMKLHASYIMLHFNEVRKFGKISVEFKRRCLYGVLMNIHQTNSIASQQSILEKFDFEKI